MISLLHTNENKEQLKDVVNSISPAGQHVQIMQELAAKTN